MLVRLRGSRFTLLLGYLFCVLGFVAMLLLWKEDIAFWRVALAYGLLGHGGILIGALLVFFAFPKREREQELLREYASADR